MKLKENERRSRSQTDIKESTKSDRAGMKLAFSSNGYEYSSSKSELIVEQLILHQRLIQLLSQEMILAQQLLHQPCLFSCLLFRIPKVRLDQMAWFGSFLIRDQAIPKPYQSLHGMQR
jgi:hypothetical protein